MSVSPASELVVAPAEGVASVGDSIRPGHQKLPATADREFAVVETVDQWPIGGGEKPQRGPALGDDAAVVAGCARVLFAGRSHHACQPDRSSASLRTLSETGPMAEWQRGAISGS